MGNRIRLVCFLMNHADRESCSGVLAEYSKDILCLCLSRLHHVTYFQGVSSSSAAAFVVQACSLLEELIRRRDVMVFSERDLARALSHLCAVVGPGRAIGGGDSGSSVGGAPVDHSATIVCVACTKVFVCMFQRYTKQLYACVPTVTLVLHAFMDRVLYEDGDTKSRNSGDTSTSDGSDDVFKRGQCLSRVCELFVAHKDIYKKHLLAPILEFVRAVETNSISLERKKSVLPSIYCLLDALSSYETKQLNALMDSKGKALFRTVYQTYQKLHTYKGR